MTFGAECPAITELKGAFSDALPNVPTITLSGARDRHGCGLAIDIMLDMKVPREYQLGNLIVDALVKHAALVQWSDLIFTEWRTPAKPPPADKFHYHRGGFQARLRGYEGDPQTKSPYNADVRHEDHIHIDFVDWKLKNPEPLFATDPFRWSDAASKPKSFRSVLAADLEAAGKVVSIPTGGASHQWLWGWWKVVQNGQDYFYYFGLAGFVGYTRTKPLGRFAPYPSPQNEGVFDYSSLGVLTITWNDTAAGQTVEWFTKVKPRPRTMPFQMAATTNNLGGPLLATKIGFDPKVDNSLGF